MLLASGPFACAQDEEPLAPIIGSSFLVESNELEDSDCYECRQRHDELVGETPQEGQLTLQFEEGVAFVSQPEGFELRIRIMEQTDFKYFVPDNQEPARPGFYIPRFRTYFEGSITRSFDYELSFQRSVEGTFDVLDANINYHPSDAFQVKIGRSLVPYSYDWYDHLEQFFITPERALFPLNFGLSREAGVMVWGELNDGRFEYAVGGFSGQLTGLQDTNTTRDAVAYINTKTRGNFNFGGSIGLGNQAYPGETLPLKTSIQASENDEASQSASSVFLEFEEDVFYSGTRRQGAIHAAWYSGSVSVETEVQAGEFRFQTPDSRPLLSVYGYHVGASYFLTGEQVTDRSIVVPSCPFNPADGMWGTGAIEAFCRFSHLSVDDTVFTEGLADEDKWTRRASIIDLGWNWYPNRFVKFYFDWQLSLYDTPVLIEPDTGDTTRDSSTFWMRAQVFF
jgi:phosphate-selective porin OprO/OprP